MPSTHRAPLRCVLGRLFLCSHQTSHQRPSVGPESAPSPKKRKKRVKRSNLFQAAKTVRQQPIGKCSIFSKGFFALGIDPWELVGGALTGNSSPHPAGHTRASWLRCLASNPYKPTSSAHSQVQIHSPCRLSSVLPPCCVSLYLSTSPPLSVLVSRCLWPCLCVSGPVSVSLAPSRCLPLPLPACSLLHQQEGTYPFLGKPVLGGAGDSQGTRKGR